MKAFTSATCLLLVHALALPGPASAADVPSNGWVTWASNRSGKHQIHLMKADGSGVTQLTTGGGTFPGWSPDGSWIAYRHDDGTAHVIRWDGSGDKKVFNGEFLFWMHDNSGMVCGAGEEYFLVQPDGTSSLLFKKSDFTRLGSEKFVPGGITHDGRYLLAFSGRYKGGFEGDNGTFGDAALGVGHNSAIVLDFTEKAKIYFFGYGCEPTAPPAGNWIYHVRGDKQHATYPDIYKMRLADLMTRSSYQGEMEQADADWGHEYFPRISNDNTWLVYGATTGCHDHSTCDYEIFIHRLGAGYANRTQLTQDTGNDTWPSLYVGTMWQPPKPTIALSSTALSFESEQGQTNPPDQEVAVSNSGGGTLATAKPSITYGGQVTDWLVVKVGGSGDNQVLTNSVTTAGLAPNTYVANVSVTANGATNSPQSYSVSLTITGEPSDPSAPAISLSPTTLSFLAVAGADPPPQSVVVGNSGEQTLGAVTTKTSYVAGSGWLVVEASGSGNDQSLLNTVTVAGLAPNTYSALVDVTAAGADNPRSYSVTLTVTAAPALPETSLHLKINSGGTAVAGWASEAPYRSGGKPYTFAEQTVTLDGLSDPAPAEVYRTCIHEDHSYSFPLPNGTYRVRLHFYDTSETVRKMDYTIEGEKVLDNFSITDEAGKGAALIKEFVVEVSDGDGLQIIADKDQGNDAFESAIEIIGVPAPTRDAGVATDAGAGVAIDAGTKGANSAAGSSSLGGGCSVAMPHSSGWTVVALLALIVFSAARRRRRRTF